jgi:hypothetical protein
VSPSASPDGAILNSPVLAGRSSVVGTNRSPRRRADYRRGVHAAPLAPPERDRHERHVLCYCSPRPRAPAQLALAPSWRARRLIRAFSTDSFAAMLMVIFGAGASYGSVDLALGPGPAQNAEATRLDGLRPPLTAELLSPRFGEFAAKYPGSVPAIVQLQHAIAGRPDPAIEAAIGDLSSLAASDNEVARHMLALRFYLSDLIETTADNWWQENHGINHYSRLLARIGVWRNAIGEPVALVTFNYDTLLDRSLDSQLAVGRKRAHWNDYVDRPDWRLYKLHGSTAWSRVLSTSGRAGSSTDPASVIARAESLNILGAELRDAHWASGDVAVPGIAVPTDRKQTFECPSHHRRRFHDDVKVVDRLLIVGWRGAEAPRARDPRGRISWLPPRHR